MAQSGAGRLVTNLGILWPGLVLVTLIVSAFFHGMRDFIASLGIASHLGLWLVALIPGIILVLVGEKMRS